MGGKMASYITIDGDETPVVAKNIGSEWFRSCRHRLRLYAGRAGTGPGREGPKEGGEKVEPQRKMRHIFMCLKIVIT